MKYNSVPQEEDKKRIVVCIFEKDVSGFEYTKCYPSLSYVQWPCWYSIIMHGNLQKEYQHGKICEIVCRPLLRGQNRL